MKVNSIIATPKSKISFGYNAQYHQELQKKLSKDKSNPEMSQYLAELDKISLSLEDEITALEKQKKIRSEKYNDLTSLLTEIKSTFAFFIETFHSPWHVTDKLITQYIYESKNENNQKMAQWRIALAKRLNTFSFADYSGFFDSLDKNIEDMVESDENQKPQNSTEEQHTTQNTEASNTYSNMKEEKSRELNAYVNAALDSLLTLYKPDEYSPVNFSSVVGMEDTKRKLKEDLIDYVKNPQQAEMDYLEYGISAPRGFLFYGPPGCGKTYLTKALSGEAKIPMFSMDVSKLGSKFINQTSNNIQKAFDCLEGSVRLCGSPVILFMDEVDSLAIKRDGFYGDTGENLKTTATLLKLIESARSKGIIVIAATNKYDLLDDAFKARFDGQVYFPLPDKEQIKKLLVSSLSSRDKGEALANNNQEIDKLTDMLEGFSNRSIVFIVDDAAKRAKRDNRSDISYQNVVDAINNTELQKPDNKNYKKMNKKPIGFTVNA